MPSAVWPAAPAPGGPRVVASPDPVGEPAEGSFRVALVQPCVYEQRSAPAYAAAFRKLAALSADAAGRGADLVVWHETAVVPPGERRRAASTVSRSA